MLIKYKVVLNIGDGLYRSVFPPNKRLNMIYEVGKWYKAPIGGFLVFNNPTSPKTLFGKSKYYKIFEVEVKQPVKLPKYGMDTGTLEQIRHLWSRKTIGNHKRAGHGLIPWPENTEAYKYVRLICEV